MNFILCQHEWINQCTLRYKVDPPTGYHFEQAHYPESEKRGGTSTVPLWYPDHIVHGILQTLALNYPCLDTRKYKLESIILSQVYPEYLRLYWEVYSFCKSVAGKVGGPKGGSKSTTTFENLSKAGKIGGSITGNQNKNLKRGICNPSVQKSAGKIGSRVTNSQKWIDPDHPELGQHSAGTLVQMQKRRGLPHDKINRKRIQ